jgi:hypothetical protein
VSSVRRIAIVAAALALVAAGESSGQTPEERARIERLARRYDDLLRREKGSEAANLPRVDSAQVRGVWIFTDSAESTVFRGALASLRGTLVDWLGRDADRLLDGARIGVRFAPAHPGWGRLLSGDAQLVAVQQYRPTAASLHGQLTHAAAVLLVRRGGASLADWRSDVRLFQDPAPLREAAYFELVTAGVPGARGCFDGSLDACARALGLRSDLPARSLDADTERRRFVATRLRHRATEPALAPSYAACVEQGDGAACLAFLERAGVREPTLSTRAAWTLLASVRDLDGGGALARFFGDTAGPVVPRLERAAGMPLDSLLARWRETVLAHRPPPTAVPGIAQWLVLGWAGVLVALATRSTRWR